MWLLNSHLSVVLTIGLMGEIFQNASKEISDRDRRDDARTGVLTAPRKH